MMKSLTQTAAASVLSRGTSVYMWISHAIKWWTAVTGIPTIPGDEG